MKEDIEEPVIGKTKTQDKPVRMNHQMDGKTRQPVILVHGSNLSLHQSQLGQQVSCTGSSSIPYFMDLYFEIYIP